MITETASKQNARRKTLSGVLWREHESSRYQEEIKKQKAKNRATRSDFTLDSSAIESRSDDYNTTSSSLYSRADLKRRKANKRKIKK